MNERPPQNPPEQTVEKEIEKFPSKEEIASIFERFLNGKTYKELKFETDGNQVSRYQIETTNEEGELVEYDFTKAKYDYRKPGTPETARFSAFIHCTVYEGEMPTPDSGSVANYLDGTWTFPK